jgi:hypothetical protein
MTGPLSSDLPRCGLGGGFDWSKRNAVRRGCGFHRWRRDTDVHSRISVYGRGEGRQWVRGRLVIVRPDILAEILVIMRGWSGLSFRSTRARFRRLRMYVFSCPASWIPYVPTTRSEGRVGVHGIHGQRRRLRDLSRESPHPRPVSPATNRAVDRLRLLLHRIGLFLADTAPHSMRDRGRPRRRLFCHARESTVSRRNVSAKRGCSRCFRCRWLIDTDKDEAGMRVLVDLHGGDPEDESAKAEFHDIKARVMFEVSLRVVVLALCC